MPTQVLLTLKSALSTTLQSNPFICMCEKCAHSTCRRLYIFFFFKEWADLNTLSDGLDEYCWYLVTFALATVGMDKKIIFKVE